MDSSEYTLLLIGGEIGTGKSTVARAITDTIGDCELLRVRDILDDLLGESSADRSRLQIEGASIDELTHGRWLLDYLQATAVPGRRRVVDSARTRRQVMPILTSRADSRLIYLSASRSTRQERFELSAVHDVVKRSMPFEEAMNHPTEVESRSVRDLAQLVVETDDLEVAEVVNAIVAWCGW